MPESYLLVDNSNTRTKFLLCRGEEAMELRIVPTAEVSVARVCDVVAGWQFDSVVLCSVVPAAARVISTAFAGYAIKLVSAADVQEIDFNSYPGISTLGADRVANALALLVNASLPAVAVDFGTAVTFDVVVPQHSRPRFAGGVIIPGCRTFAESLHLRTALLPAGVTLEKNCPVIGRTTQEAMVSGVRIGYVGMIDALLDGIEAELGEPLHVVLTGGDAELMATFMRRSCKVEPAHTLQGIALAAGYRLRV